MKSKLDLNLLVVFLEVYRLRSITLASESLGLTQPGVSGALKRLQSQLDAPLFIREGRGISPTHVAIQLANEVEPALTQVESALGNVSGFDIQSHRSFTVYVNEIILHTVRSKIEADTTLGNCSIHLHMTPNSEDELLHQLSLHKADLAIDVGVRSNPAFFYQPFIDDDVVVVCRNGHPRIHKSLSREQFESEQRISIQQRRIDLLEMNYFTDENLMPKEITCEGASILSMLALVSESDSIAAVSALMAKKYADLFNLKTMPLPFVSKPFKHFMVWHKRSDNNPANKWLRNKLSKML
ncbi:LysR family transcriptional regulator [Photobacterium angustum]|uniref:LysR family transcriptional regulator n=1 Tax=Photobacterium angustum TaxID=661 RepID=A0ABX5H7N1_PHOAN|nr:LysR family transcriptional regulator [Photobacterium angustum]KJG40777.1 LysR family transcriptional regulator [Photobacterium angustum]PSX12111.1 LysR family transcriptional regulator [Photobacterium angustum]